MTLNFHALWTLTGMGAVVFSTFAAPSWRTRSVAALAFAIAATAGGWFGLPSAETIGLAVAGGAFLQVLRPATRLVAPLLGGVLGALWGTMLGAQGVPMGVALAVGAGWCAVSIACSRRPDFAPTRLRDEALLIVGVCAVAVAMLPGVADGWTAALNLSLQSSATPAAEAAIPMWTLAIGGTSLALGALFSLWSRR